MSQEFKLRQTRQNKNERSGVIAGTTLLENGSLNSVRQTKHVFHQKLETGSLSHFGVSESRILTSDNYQLRPGPGVKRDCLLCIGEKNLETSTG